MKKVAMILFVLLVLAVTYMYLSTNLFLSLLQKNNAKQEVIQTTQQAPEELVNNANYSVKKITDRSGLFSVEIPSDWSVTIFGPQLLRISSISAGISKKSIKFSVIVSGEERKISSKNEPVDVLVDGVPAKYYTVEAPLFSKKKILTVEFSDNKKYYSLSLAYNEKTYPEGKDVFENIVSSFDILDVEEEADVRSIEVVPSDSLPSQVNVLIKGEFPNSCSEFGEIVEDQNGRTFFVSVYKAKTKDSDCTEGPISFEKTLSLDTIGLRSGDYVVDVNGVKAQFSIPEEQATSTETMR